MLRNYGMQTILDRIQGVIFGRPRGYTDEQKQELRNCVRELVVVEFNRADIPILLNFDIGHTAPQFVIPIGVMATISSENERVTLDGPIFKKV